MIITETTGMYAIKREALMEHGTRLTADAVPYVVDGLECLDIDTESDFERALLQNA